MRVFAIGSLTVLCAAALAFAADIPPGTELSVRLGQTISSDKAKSGDNWSGTLASDVNVNGNVVAKRGDPVQGKVVNAQASGRLEGRALLELQVTSVNGVPVVTSTVSSEGGSHKGRNIKGAGGGAAVGAIIGAIAGGGKGAAIGAGAGAAAGTAGAAVHGKKDVKFPVETVLNFTVK